MGIELTLPLPPPLGSSTSSFAPRHDLIGGKILCIMQFCLFCFGFSLISRFSKYSSSGIRRKEDWDVWHMRRRWCWWWFSRSKADQISNGFLWQTVHERISAKLKDAIWPTRSGRKWDELWWRREVSTVILVSNGAEARWRRNGRNCSGMVPRHDRRTVLVILQCSFLNLQYDQDQSFYCIGKMCQCKQIFAVQMEHQQNPICNLVAP